MAQAATSKPAANAPPLSFGDRLKAWWEGYDAEHLAAKAAAKANASAQSQKEIAAPPPAPSDDRWNQDRIDISQLIWGKAFCGPGGPDFIISQSKLLALTPEMSVADLSAGLGGPMRILVEHFNVWVSGFEMSPNLVKTGNEMSQMAGLAKKAPLELLDLSLAEPFGRRYDRAYGRIFLSKFQNLEVPIRKVCEALKPDAMVLFTDYFITSPDVLRDPDFISLQADDPHPLQIHTQEEVLKELEANKLVLRVNESITDVISKMVTHAWKDASTIVAKLTSQPQTARQVPALLKEAEVWTKRLRLMNDGKLEMRRMMATKPPK